MVTRLQELEEELSRTKVRTDLSVGQKEQLGRILRRRIRKFKANLSDGGEAELQEEESFAASHRGTPPPVPHEDSSDDEESEDASPRDEAKAERRRLARQKRRNSRVAGDKGLAKIFTDMEKGEYLDNLATELTGWLVLEGSQILKTGASHGFSGVLIIDEAQKSGISAEDLAQVIIAKFQARWGTDPEWFTLYHQGDVPVFCLGPVHKASGWK